MIKIPKGVNLFCVALSAFFVVRDIIDHSPWLAVMWVFIGALNLYTYYLKTVEEKGKK